VDEWKDSAARGTSFLLLVGASGAGKSSLARAGLVPRITAPGVVPTVDLWRVAVMRPSETSGGPIMSLAARLFDAEEDIPEDERGRLPALPEIAESDYRTPAALARLFAEASSAASTPVTRALARAAETEAAQQGYARPVRAQLLIVVDQLDELFGPDVTAEQRAAFARLLAVLAETGQVWLLATLRADLYERFLAELPCWHLRPVERPMISRPRVRRSWPRSCASLRKRPGSSSRPIQRLASSSTNACYVRPSGPTCCRCFNWR
jgi:hypothetical protein